MCFLKKGLTKRTTRPRPPLSRRCCATGTRRGGASSGIVYVCLEDGEHHFVMDDDSGFVSRPPASTDSRPPSVGELTG